MPDAEPFPQEIIQAFEKGYLESYGHYTRSNQFGFKSLPTLHRYFKYSSPILLILVNTSTCALQPFH